MQYSSFFGQFVIYVNRVGFEDGIAFWGGSEVIDPSGKTLAKAPAHDEKLLFVEIDPADVRRERIQTPLLRDEKLSLTLEELGRIQRERYA